MSKNNGYIKVGAKVKANEKHVLKMSDKEILALTDILDAFSAISDGIEDDGTAKEYLKRVDKMLNRNGFKRLYN